MAGQYDVFISYRRSDSDISARFIDGALEQKGIAVFRDKDELEAGTFKEQLERAIKECTAFIVLLTAYTFADRGRSEDWVLHEIQYAKDCGKIIIPVMQNGCKIDRAHFPDSIAYIAELEGVELASENWEQGVERLCELVQKAKRRQTMNAMCPHCGWETEQVFRDEHTPIHCEECNQAFMLLEGADLYFQKGCVIERSEWTENTLIKYLGHAKTLNIGKGVKGIHRIGTSAFSHNSSLEKIVINYYVAEESRTKPLDFHNIVFIDTAAFEGCDSLQSVVIHCNSALRLGKGVFRACSSLRTVSFENCDISRIPENSFEGCENLTEIHLPDSIRYIGERAFAKCLRLKNVSYPASAKVSKNAFQSVRFYLDQLQSEADENGLIIYDGVLMRCSNPDAKQVIIPDHVTTIDSFAFYACEKMRAVILPRHEVLVRERAFLACPSLVSVDGDILTDFCSPQGDPIYLELLDGSFSDPRDLNGLMVEALNMIFPDTPLYENNKAQLLSQKNNHKGEPHT